MAAEAIVTGNWGRNKNKKVTPTTTTEPLKASPLEQNKTFRQGTNLAGSSVKLADGTDYQLKGASSGIQPAPTPPVATPPTPAPPVTATPEVSATATATPTPPPATNSSADLKSKGLDEERLLAAGISQEQIDKMKLILNPAMGAQENLMANAEAEKDYNIKSLAEEQAMVEKAYAGIKSQRESITQAQQEIINDSSDVQKAVLEQGRQKELFENSQAQQKYKLEQVRNERETLKAQRDLEHKLARSLSASLGAAFSFNGMMRVAELQQAGIDTISDLQASTAYGMAEFSFRAQDIERFYTIETNKIEVDRRNQNITILKTLNDDLAAIDEKVLLSAQEKKQQARDAIQKYFEKKDQIDTTTGDLMSAANTALFEEKDKLEKEAEERQLLDLERSAKEGFFVNKYGEYISKNANGTPKVFTGDMNESLSKTLGYAVDGRGQPILDDKGNKISFEDPSLKMIRNALNNHVNGTATGYENEVLTEHLGKNDYIASKMANGSYGGQCGTFVRSQFTNESSWEGVCWIGEQYKAAGYASRNDCSKGEKRKMVDERGIRRGEGTPKVGDVVVFDGSGYGSAGHYAIINEIAVDGSWTLSESNLDLKGTVNNSRVIKNPMSNNQIYGTFTPDLKKEVLDAQPTLVVGTGGGEDVVDEGSGVSNGIKQVIDMYIGTKEEYDAMKGTEQGRQILQELRMAGLSNEMIDAYFSNKGREDAGEGFATSSISYPGRPQPSPENAKYASAITTDAYGNVRVNWNKLPSDLKVEPADKKAINWAINMQRSEDLLNLYEQAGIDTGIGNDFLSGFSPEDDLGQVIQKALQQKVLTPQQYDIMAARMRWTEGVLRKTSGAAINVGEYLTNGMAYFPQPGAQNKENLRQARQSLTNDYVNEAGNAGFLYDAYLSSSPTFKPLTSASSSISPLTQEKSGGLLDTAASMIWGGDDKSKTDKYFGITNAEDKKMLDEIYASDEYKNGEITDQDITAALLNK